MMISIKLKANEERLVVTALLQYRNRLNREKDYDGVSRPRYNAMRQKMRDADSLLDRIGEM